MFRRKTECVFFTDQSTPNDTLFILRGGVGENVSINFGDSSIDSTITFSGTAIDDTIFHNYGGSSIYNIKLAGAIKNITRFIFYKRSYGGSNQIRKLKSLTYLEHIVQDGQPRIDGNLSDFSSLPLTYLVLSSNIDSVVGDLSSLSNMNLDKLVLSTNVIKYDVTGDISDLSGSNFSSGVYLTANNLTYTTFNIPDTWMTMYFGICGLSTSEVDQIIIDVESNGTSSGFLDLDQNAYRSAASTTAYNALVSRSWSVFVGGP